VENNRWAIHASNNGPSLIVDNKGYIIQTTPFLAEAITGNQIQLIQKKTFYTRFGDIFALFCITLSGFVFILRGGKEVM